MCNKQKKYKKTNLLKTNYESRFVVLIIFKLYNFCHYRDVTNEYFFIICQVHIVLNV